MFPNSGAPVQALLVFFITIPVIYMSVKNNDMTLLANLAALSFGYYFGRDSDLPPPAH